MKNAIVTTGIFLLKPCPECNGEAQIIANTTDDGIKLRAVCNECGRATGYADLTRAENGVVYMIDLNAHMTVRAWWNIQLQDFHTGS